MELSIKLNEYKLQDTDTTSFPKYFGYVNEVGEWYIIREASTGAFRYARASVRTRGKYPSQWASRVSLEYHYWETSF